VWAYTTKKHRSRSFLCNNSNKLITQYGSNNTFHNPSPPPKPNSHSSLPDSNAIEMPASDVLKLWAPSSLFPPWIQAYYTQIIMADEIRLLSALGKDATMPLPAGEQAVKGAKKVVTRD
jgi:hypothetical protein